MKSLLLSLSSRNQEVTFLSVWLVAWIYCKAIRSYVGSDDDLAKIYLNRPFMLTSMAVFKFMRSAPDYWGRFPCQEGGFFPIRWFNVFFLIREGVWNTWFSWGEGYEISDQLDGEGYEIPLKSDNGIRHPPPPVNNDNPLEREEKEAP